jgi:ubiquinone/menaquinone biosynthesis C-methylase UbiE
MTEIVKLGGTRQLEFDREMVERAYDRWAPIYDLVFGGVFGKGRRAAIAATNSIGGRVLEVGVGTGISLPQYASNTRIFGIDISAAMLRKAKTRVAELGLKNVEGLAVMDAEKLDFPDGSFDVVMAQYVVTAVANPEATLDEFARVLRPGGEVILLSRGQRRRRNAPLHRATDSTGGASARLAHGIRVVALRPMGRSKRRDGTGGAPSGAAVRTFLADSLSQGRGRRLTTLSATRSHHATCHYDVVTYRTSNPCSQVPTLKG